MNAVRALFLCLLIAAGLSPSGPTPANADDAAAGVAAASAAVDGASPEQFEPRGWGRWNNDAPPPRGFGQGQGMGQGRGPQGPPSDRPRMNGPRGPFAGPPNQQGWGRNAENEGVLDKRAMRFENPELAEVYEAIRRIDLQLYQLLDRQTMKEIESPGKELKDELRPLFDQQFDLDVQRQRMEIQMMEERLARLKELLKKKEENKDRFIELQLNTLPRVLERRPPGMRPGGPGPMNGNQPFIRKPPLDPVTGEPLWDPNGPPPEGY
ncbi:MAG: hypothetical protein GC154_15870 [bacterium]|nr:hypothetical protein [bacterium]